MGGKHWYANGNFVEDNYFSESRRLLEHGFNSYSQKTVLSEIEPIGTISVSLCKEQDYVTVQPAGSIEATLLNELDPALFERKVSLPDSLQAPIQAGQVLGTISVSYEDRDFGTVELVAATTLEKSTMLAVLDTLRQIFSLMWVKILLLVLVVLILILVLRRMVFGPSRRNRRNSRRPKTYSSSYRGRRK